VFQVRWSTAWSVSQLGQHAQQARNADMRQGRDHGSTSAVRVVSPTCGLPLVVQPGQPGAFWALMMRSSATVMSQVSGYRSSHDQATVSLRC
jgi:hypothetical protein